MKKGFIIIQIDGLSYKVLNKAIQKGYAPFLKSLIEKEGFKVNKMYCGLPAVTCRTQLGIMYGSNEDISGYMWFDRKRSCFFTVFNSSDAKQIENKRSNGILNKGSSINNLFSGGAEEKVSISYLEWQSLFKFFSGSTICFWIMIALFILPLDFIFSMITRFKRGSLLSIFGAIIFLKFTANFALEGIKRGSFSTYVNFFEYDEISHYFGCESGLSMWVIKRSDQVIRKIYGTATQSKIIDYDLFILSDHGQVKSVSFENYFKKKLEDIIEETLEKNEVVDGGIMRDRIILNQVEYIMNTAPWWLRIFSRSSKMIAKRFFWKSKPLLIKKGDVIVISEGDIAHIYFNIRKEKMLYEEIKKFYSKLVGALMNHKGIRFLAVSSKNGIRILGRKGEILFNREERLYGKDPLFGVFDRNFLLDSIKELVEMKNSGDIIVFGSKLEEEVIDFSSDHFRSSHGGIEKSEQEIFIISPPFLSSSIEDIKNPKELYLIFIKYARSKNNYKLPSNPV